MGPDGIDHLDTGPEEEAASVAPSGAVNRLERALAERDRSRYLLRLYVTGATQRSLAAIASIRRICDEHLQGRYDLEVVDLYRDPVLGEGEQILAAPTLVRKLPLPLRRLIGDMTDKERILVGLDLRPKE